MSRITLSKRAADDSPEPSLLELPQMLQMETRIFTTRKLLSPVHESPSQAPQQPPVVKNKILVPRKLKMLDIQQNLVLQDTKAKTDRFFRASDNAFPPGKNLKSSQ